MPVPGHPRRRRIPLRTSVAIPVAAVVAGVFATGLGVAVPSAAAPGYALPAAPADDDVVTTTVTTDPDDTAGRYDLAAVQHRVQQLSPPHGAVRVRWTVRTHQSFDASQLTNRHRRFTVELDTDGQPGAERSLRFVRRDGRLVAEVVSHATRDVIATLPAGRPDTRTLTTAGYKGLVGARRYFWWSTYHDRGSTVCGRSAGAPVSCQDSAPENGWIQLDKPAWPDPTG